MRRLVMALALSAGASLAVSQDGKRLAFVAEPTS
jgi:hypothetical protein